MDARGGWRVAALLLAGLFSGCGGDDGLDCSFEACGGDPVGEWNVEGICLDGSGDVMVPGCDGVRLDFSGVTASGTMRFDEDGSYSGQLEIGGTGRVTLPRTCLPQGTTCEQLQSEEVSCVTSGGTCVCSVQAETVTSSGAGSWEVSGSSITLTGEGDEPSTGEFCAEPDELRVHYEQDGFIGTYVLSRS